MNAIEDLKQKRRTLFRQVKAIDTVFKIYGHVPEEVLTVNSRETVAENNVGGTLKPFPVNLRLEKQILWVFENAIHKGLKLHKVQKMFNEQAGRNVKIDNKVRKMKREGKLILVKYNNKHIHSFWGLPSWVKGKDFKPEYRPDEADLPEITSSEVIRE